MCLQVRMVHAHRFRKRIELLSPASHHGTSEGITISQLDLSNYVPPAMASTRVDSI